MSGAQMSQLDFLEAVRRLPVKHRRLLMAAAKAQAEGHPAAEQRKAWMRFATARSDPTPERTVKLLMSPRLAAETAPGLNSAPARA